MGVHCLCPTFCIRDMQFVTCNSWHAIRCSLSSISFSHFKQMYNSVVWLSFPLSCAAFELMLPLPPLRVFLFFTLSLEPGRIGNWIPKTLEIFIYTHKCTSFSDENIQIVILSNERALVVNPENTLVINSDETPNIIKLFHFTCITQPEARANYRLSY